VRSKWPLSSTLLHTAKNRLSVASLRSSSSREGRCTSGADVSVLLGNMDGSFSPRATLVQKLEAIWHDATLARSSSLPPAERKEEARPIPKCHGRRCREWASRGREVVQGDPSMWCDVRAQRKLEPLGNSN